MTTMTTATANALYSEANDKGEGFAPREDDVWDAVAEMIEDGAEMVLDRQTTSDVIVVRDGDDLVAIGGDGMGRGAWACVIAKAKDFE